MGRLLASLVTFLILALGAAFTVPAFVDWNAYRPNIEEAASEILGRRVAINGDIDIVLLPEPHIHAGKVAAAFKIDGAPLLTAEAVDISLSLQSLLGGTLEADALKLVRPVLTADFFVGLEESKTGQRAAFPISAEANAFEIEDGRIDVLSRDRGPSKSITLTNIAGTLTAPQPGSSSYRFAGRFSYDGRSFDAKFAASSSAANLVKVSGALSDPASKATVQADGQVDFAGSPSFEGTFGLTSPNKSDRDEALPFDVQVRAAGKVSLSRASLTDLTLTLTSNDRPQILTGSGEIVYAGPAADVILEARSLDMNAFNNGERSATGAPSGDWRDVRAAWDRLLWFYPAAAIKIALSVDQVQVGSDLIENVKIDANRKAGQWVLQEAAAALPGESRVTLSGALTNSGGLFQLSGRAQVIGKNLRRAIGFFSPEPPATLALPSKPFAIRGTLTLSPTVTAFEGISGEVDGEPFTAALKVDRQAAAKLQFSLAGERLNLGSLAAMQPGAPSPLETADLAWRSLSARLSGGVPLGSADFDISARTLNTGSVEAKNVALRAKLTPDLLTVTRLNAETSDGLLVRGEGVVPLRGAGLGKFEARVEAPSGAALLQVMDFAGYGVDDLAGRRPEDLVPAVFTIAHSSDMQTQTASVTLNGNAAAVRVEGRGQIKGSLADFRSAQIAAQINLAAVDGAKLVAVLFPSSASSPGASLAPGIASIRIDGTGLKFQTSATIKASAVQAQLDGSTDLRSGAPVFSGRISAASQTPELFLPAAALSFLGGEPKVNLKAEGNVVLAKNRMEADALRAETPKNVVTGRLILDSAGPLNKLEADLKADQLSLIKLMGPLLVKPQDQTAVVSASPAQPEMWSNRPFSLALLRETDARVSIAAKSLKVTEIATLSDAQVIAKIDKGRLEVQKLEGKAFGGDASATLLFNAQGNVLSATGTIALDKADLSAFAAPGSSSLMSGKMAARLTVTGQGLSPRGLISVLSGRGLAVLSDGKISRISASGALKTAEELTSSSQPLNEDAIKKRLLDASQAGDFKFSGLHIPLAVHDGILEIRRASFRNGDGTVRMEAVLDVSKMEADTSWQLGVSSDPRQKWPPVKLLIAGPVGELGVRPRTIAADDLIRAVLVRKMEGDISKLENLSKPQASSSPWTTTQEPANGANKKRGDGAQSTPADAGGAQSSLNPGPSDFEARMRDALQSKTAGEANANTR